MSDLIVSGKIDPAAIGKGSRSIFCATGRNDRQYGCMPILDRHSHIGHGRNFRRLHIFRFLHGGFPLPSRSTIVTLSCIVSGTNRIAGASGCGRNDDILFSGDNIVLTRPEQSDGAKLPGLFAADHNLPVSKP